MRRFGAGAGILSLAGACVVTYAVLNPPPLPEAKLHVARRDALAARQVPGIEPGDLVAVDSLGAVMERLYARERTRWVRFRYATELDRAAGELSMAAARAESAAVVRREQRWRFERLRQEQMAARLKALTAPADRMPGARRLRRAYQRAEMALGVARDLDAQGMPESMAVQLDSAMAALERAEAHLDRRMLRLRDPELGRRWQDWVDQTVAATRGGRQAIVVDKSRRRCSLLRDGRVVAEYVAEFGHNGLVDKLHAGDGATPEGRYRITHKNAGSRYHRALLISYPDAADRLEYEAARRNGLVPAGAGPGGLIEIHGHGGRGVDWTDGCVALRNDDMEALYGRVDAETPVTIVGAAQLPGDPPETMLR